MQSQPVFPTSEAASVATGLRARGFVLPVVLVMLVVMSTVVLLMIRRGTVDERLAANIASVVTAESGGNYALRTCERWVRASRLGLIDPPPTVAPAAQGAATPTWRIAAQWANAAELPSDFYGPGVDRARCLVEAAPGDLMGNGDTPQEKSELDKSTVNQLPTTYVFAKFRITAEAQVPGRDGGVRLARAQSEMRVKTNQ